MEDNVYEPITSNPNEPATKEDFAKLMKAFESLFEQTGITLVTATATKEDVKEIKNDVSQLRTELHAVREEIKQLDGKIETIGQNRKEDADALSEEYLSLKTELAELAKRVKKLEAQVSR